MQFKSKVNIIRIAKVAGAMGQAKVSNVLYSNLPCRINWKRGQEKIFFAKNTYFRDAKLYCRIIDVTVQDQVQYNNKTYEIVDVSNVDNSDRYLVLDLRLIE